MFCNKDSVATILALKDVINIPETYVFYNSWVRDSFLLVFKSGRIMEFIRASYGLYYYDLHHFEQHEHKVTDKNFVFLTHSIVLNQTVVQNESFVTKKELNRAKLARDYQELLMFPSTNTMQKLLSRNLIKMH